MAGPSLVDVLQSQVVLFKSFLFTDEFCRIFASVSRETRVGNLVEFRNAECASDNLLELQAYTQDETLGRFLENLRDEELGCSVGEFASPHSPGSSS